MKLTYTTTISRKMVEEEVGRSLTDKQWKDFQVKYDKAFQKALDRAALKVEDDMLWKITQEMHRPAPRSIRTARKPVKKV